MTNQELKKELPPRYYLANFNAILCFAEKMYGPLLSEEEHAFIKQFRQLSEEGRCMFLRLANRRGRFFRTGRLVYPEIASIEGALEELLLHHFIAIPNAGHQALAGHFLQVYQKAELVKVYKELKPEAKGLQTLKKGELISRMLETFSWSTLLEATGTLGPVIIHNFEQELEMLKFLYFGHLWGDMAEFVIRDLGMRRFEEPDEDKLVALFQSREEIEDKFSISLAYEHFRELRGQNCPETLYTWYINWQAGKAHWCELARPLFNRLTIKVGSILERHQQPYWALEVYEKTVQPPARERRVRLLQKTGAVQQALELCYQIEHNPQNADELFFARDFGGRLLKKKKVKSTTLHLSDAHSILISREYQHQVEQGVIRHLQDQGQEAMYSENYFWRSLFGLVFWDIIYDQDAPVFHSPLQRAPSDLYLPQFLENRQGRMEERLDYFSGSQALITWLEKTSGEKWGLGNPLVSWHENTLPLLRAVCACVKPVQLKAVLLEMARNLKENGRGFPDLFSWNGREYAFIEVKSPNDTLSAQQLYWLQFFKEQDIKARVLRVMWKE